MVKITFKPPRLFMLQFNLLKLPFAVVVFLHLSTFIPPLLVPLLIHTNVIVFFSGSLGQKDRMWKVRVSLNAYRKQHFCRENVPHCL